MCLFPCLHRSRPHPDAARRGISLREAAALRKIAALIGERTQVLLHISEHRSLLVIVADRQLLLARQLRIGLAQLANRQTLTRIEAARQMGRQLRRALEAFERHFPQVPLTRMLVAPGTLPWEFMALANDALPIPLRALDLNQVFDFSLTPELSGDEGLQSKYLVVLSRSICAPRVRTSHG